MKKETFKINGNFDYREVILTILDNSDRSFKNWEANNSDCRYIKEMNFNNKIIRSLLDTIR